MVQRIPNAVAETDETAWLEACAELVRTGQWSQIDTVSLAEYLADMARHDRREVVSRLAKLIAHLLKWQFQPEMRTASLRRQQWSAKGKSLANCWKAAPCEITPRTSLAKAYRFGVKQAAAESALSEETFPWDCPWTLDTLLESPLAE